MPRGYQKKICHPQADVVNKLLLIPKFLRWKFEKLLIEKKGKAAILTSTPYKEELENSLKEKNKKVNLKKQKLIY